MQFSSRISRFIESVSIRTRRRSYPWILLGLFILYLATYPIIRIPLLISAPVALAGWFYYQRGGLSAAILAFFVNLILFSLFEGQPELKMLFDLRNGFLIGHILALLVGVGVGYLRQDVDNHVRIDQRLHMRERILTLISQTTRDILERRFTNDSHEWLISLLVDSFSADHAHLIRWDKNLQQMNLITLGGPPERSHIERIVVPEDDQPIRELMQAMHVVAVSDIHQSNQVLYPPQLKQLALETSSALMIPLSTSGYKFGTIVLGFKSPRAFTAEEIDLVELASVEIALAFKTVQQETRIERQLREANSLAAIERVLSESERVGLETVLQLIVDSAKELIPKTTHVVLHLLDEEKQMLTPRAVAGFNSSPQSSLRMQIGQGVAGQVLEIGETIAIPDIRRDPRFIDQTAPVSFRSLIVAPVGSSRKRVGTISLHSYEVGIFDPLDVNLLSALGIQAAIAIENANLLETTRQSYKELNVLYHLTRNASASLNPDVIIRDAVNYLQQIYKFYHIQIFATDPESGDLRARHGAGTIGNRLFEQGYFLPAGFGIVGHVGETGKPFFTNNVDQVVFHRPNPLLPDTRSEMALPLTYEDRVLGVLDVQQTSSNPISLDQMKLMGTITSQLSMALQQAEMYAELQKSLEAEKEMRDRLIQAERLAVAGQLLASVSHELNNPLQAIENALFLLRDEKSLSRQAIKDLEIILSETERMTTILNRLRTTYRPIQAQDFEQVQLNSIINNTHALTATLLRHKGIHYEFSPDPQLPATSGIPDQIRQVMLNLFMNAIEAMPEGGNLLIKTFHEPNDGRIMVAVSDDGIGIPPEIQPRIFEPFITSKRTGSGLGLSITRDIVLQHQGDIQAENNVDGGATFKLWFPTGRDA